MKKKLGMVFLCIFTLFSGAAQSEILKNNPSNIVHRDSVFYTVSQRDCCNKFRIYHPNTGDRLVLELPGHPENIFWSRDYEFLYYRIDSTIYKLPWKQGASPSAVVKLPGELPYEPHIWLNTKTGKWRMYNIVFGAKNETGYEANVRDFDPRTGSWQEIAKSQTEMCEGGDGSSCGAEVEEFVKDKGDLILLEDLLDSMRAHPNLLKHNPPHEGDPDGKVVNFPSRYVKQAGLEVTLAFGDTLHAISPVTWISNDGSRKSVYKKSDYPCSSQVAFEESTEWMLVGTEYNLECARLINMSSGEIVFRFPKNSRYSVWVPHRRYQ